MAESTQPPVFLIAKILGISSSAFLSGFAFSTSYLAIPSIGLSPLPLRLQQWKILYDLGKWVSPPVTAFSGVVWGVVSYLSYTITTSTSSSSSSSIVGNSTSLPVNNSGVGVEDWKLYALAGVITFAVLPFTVLVIGPVNGELIARAERARVGGKGLKDGEKETEKTERLVRSWSDMTYIRAVLPMVGAWVGLYAALR